MLKIQQTVKAALLCLAALFCATLIMSATSGTALNAQDKRLVAVLDPFTTGNITQLNKETVRGAMNSSLVNTGIYRVVDKERTAKVLKERNFKRSQLGDRQQVKILGKSLSGANLIYVTDLTKEGSNINAQISIFDVATGEVTNAAQKLITRDDPASIERGIREAMAELLGIKTEPAPRQIEASERPRPDRDREHSRHAHGRMDSQSAKVNVVIHSVPEFAVAEGFEKLIRTVKGVTNVDTVDYQSLVATYEVTTNLTVQELAAGISNTNWRVGSNTYGPAVEEASGNTIKARCKRY